VTDPAGFGPAPGLLAGSSALVTGAGRGIGRGIAIEMARAGASVVLFSRHPDECAEVESEIVATGGRAHVAAGDIRDRTSVERALDGAEEAGVPVDILVNNAGVLVFSRFWEYDESTSREIIDTNLLGTFQVSQAAARRWVAGGVPGRIVNIASVESEVAYPDQAPYAASKGGILTMTRVLARELGAHGIRVNAIGPGPIDTPLSQRFREQSEAGVVFRRLGRPSEVGQAAVFLASEMASFVTGTILYVDGGYLLS
jgi:NAD(P)-dependent dehydrogenase (short-subunit alcohol dehydrogenase family)